MIEKKWKSIFVIHPIYLDEMKIDEIKEEARRCVEKAYDIKDTSIIDINTDDFKDLSGNKLYDGIYILTRIVDLLWISEVAYFPEGWENDDNSKIIHYICETCKFPYIHVKDGNISYHLFNKKENAK